MNKVYILLVSLSLSSLAYSQKPKGAGDFIESTSINEAARGKARKLNYLPEDNDFVCVNGNNRYTRALYGGHTLFRLETSDRPIFALYNKTINRNVNFRIIVDGKELALESTEYCKAIYGEGNRRYVIKDPMLGSGTIYLTAIALNDVDGALWKVELNGSNKKVSLKYNVSEIKASKLFRMGDMGVDPKDAFDMPSQPKELTTGIAELKNNKSYVLGITVDKSSFEIVKQGEKIKSNVLNEKYFEAENKRNAKLAQRISFSTPDKFINPIGNALSLAADGIWDGMVWEHGAVGWRMPLSGWRAAYAGDFLNWHDRAKTHFDAYAASQVTDVKPIYAHPTQDSALNMARAEKKWGTQMYSNGYICRNPYKNNQMHHYDMNLCYIDELLWHFNWTGDLEYAKKMWPVIVRHLDWEKRNFDPDNDGLYDAYCCIWASDALYYNSGAVTHSTAYNYRGNKMAAKIAKLIGEDGTKYEKEAEKILKALNEQLWVKDKGHWAEYKEFMGNKRVHSSAALWTIYHAIDSDICTPEQAYLCTKYVDNEIPHIRLIDEGIDSDLYTLSTTNWLPYSWSINNVAFAEVYHTALAYWEAGRNEEAMKILKANILDGMYLGHSPGNFGQISHYDAARGECYRDFGDPIGIASRTFIQGLYGIIPNLLENEVVVKPGFPNDWNEASVNIPDISYSFSRKDNVDTYKFNPSFVKKADIVLKIRKIHSSIDEVKINGKKVTYTIEHGVEYDIVSIRIPENIVKSVVTIKWEGNSLSPRVLELKKEEEISNKELNLPGFDKVDDRKCEPIDIKTLLNDSINNIFTNKYISPRSPFTTLQMPTQGIGEWCHPLLTGSIDDSGLRKLSSNNIFNAKGVPFISMQKEKNILFASLWDNYPNSVKIDLKGKASHIYLMMAGTTNHMQSRIVNGLLIAEYKDGSKDTLKLINPNNWCPIEQDYFTDGKAFNIKTAHPYRVHLKSGVISDNLEKELNIKGVYGREIDGGAGVLIDFPVNKTKELSCLKLKTISNDVIIGIIGVTLQR